MKNKSKISVWNQR